MKRILTVMPLVFGLLISSSVLAQETYFDIERGKIPYTAGQRLTDPGDSQSEREYLVPYSPYWRSLPVVRLDGEGEAYLVSDAGVAKPGTPYSYKQEPGGHLVIRLPRPGPAAGTITVYDWDGEKPVSARFEVPAASASPASATAFWRGRAWYFHTLASGDIPGTAWFRHEAAVSADRAGSSDPAKGTQQAFWAGRACTRANPENQFHSDFNEAIDLFSGTRALSENLQLERLVCPSTSAQATVDLAAVEGITVQEIDWAPLNKGLNPAQDPLATWVPSDNYGLFFPTFRAMIDLLDEANEFGTPALAWLEPRFEDANTRERYMKQICLGADFMARQLGPAVIASVAMTGSDPFIRMGSDITLLFEATQPDMLEGYIKSKHEAAVARFPGGEKVQGTAGGVAWSGVRNPDRQLSSYLARVGNVVVVSNSVVALERTIAAFQGKLKSVEELGEYTYFRNRYQRAKEGETAFLLIPDEAIRKWASPRWRIADSRRVRMAGVLSELVATILESQRTGIWPPTDFDPENGGATGQGEGAEGTKAVESPKGVQPAAAHRIAVRTTVPGEEKFYATDAAPASPTYGSLQFMTPIVELEVAKASPEEVESYRWFRDRYQHGWRRYFDPIGIQFKVGADVVAADVTVMPLIMDSDYRELIELTSGASLPVEAPMPAEALAIFGISLNRESHLARELTNFANSAAPSVLRSGFNFVGKWAHLYVADDPLWAQLAAQKSEREIERMLEKEFYRIPIVFEMAISNPLGLASVLTGLRALVESSAPGLTIWETLKYKGTPYVKVTASIGEGDDNLPRKLTVFYTTTNDVFTVTLNQTLLEKAIDRRTKGKKAKASAEPMAQQKWLGQHCGGAANKRVLELLEPLIRAEVNHEMRRASWASIPILNTWKAMFPKEDPVAVHQRLFGTILSCPGGGTYVWNQADGTMESTVYGHPGQTKEGPGLLRPPLDRLTTANFGLTFENDGLRASMVLGRKAK